MKPLRIAVTCFPTLGGSGIVATEVGTRLAARGHHVTFFAPERPGRLIASAPNVGFERVVSDAAQYTQALAAALASAADFDVIHSHYALPHALAAQLAKQQLLGRGRRAPRLVTTLHGTDVTQLGVELATRDAVQRAAHDSDALSVPSAWLRDRACELLALAEPPSVIPNFVDPTAFRPRDGDLRELFPHLPGWDDPQTRPRVLWHGSSFRALKRVDDAVRALALLQGAQAVALVLVGDGPERPRVEQLAAELGVSDRLRCLGAKPHFEELLPRADAFVLPSETESFGLAALEALACGVPVVASDVGGLPEVVRHAITGLLVPPAMPSALAAALRQLFADEARRRAMARAAREDAVQRFSPEPAIDRYEALLTGA